MKNLWRRACMLGVLLAGHAAMVSSASAATATVTLVKLVQTYKGSPLSPTVKTKPAKLTVDLTYGGSSTAPTAAGSYAVVGTVNSPGYTGSASGTFVINKAKAKVVLGNLKQTYDGTAKSVSVTTVPAGLTVDITYNGSASAPSEVGSYTVVATINDPNHAGGATKKLVISRPKAPKLTLHALPHAQVGQPYNQLVGSGTGGLPPYHFQLGTGGGFPPIGIVMDIDGNLSGTPTTPGTYKFDVSLVDLAASQSTKAATLIVDPPKLSISDVSATEGQSGTKVFNFTVSLSAPSTQTITVKYATANGTATAGSDYVAVPSTTLTFNPGDEEKTIAVTVNGDTTVEPDETFFVRLTGGVNATLISSQGTGTIINDDASAADFDGYWSVLGTETTPYDGSTFEFDFRVSNGQVYYASSSSNGTVTSDGTLQIDAGLNPGAPAVISTTLSGQLTSGGDGMGTFSVNSTSYGVESGTWIVIYRGLKGFFN